MGTYTMPLKRVLEFTQDIGLENYPIFDETYREKLNQKIIRHYFLREIGHETIEIFKYQMETKMGEIMPLYNQHYVLSLLAIDPLSTMSIHSITDMTSTASAANTGGNTSSSGAKSRAVASETPQTELSENGDYATSMQDNISDTTATGSSTENSNTSQAGNNDNNVTGYQGHAPLLILQARQALVNIDMLVIDELKELFMLIWQNNDEFTNNSYPYGGHYYGLY